jgi:predicted transcriptional regulator
MTILDRLSQKGIVARRKVGRAYLYRANLQPSDAQESAVEQLVAGFFGGSRGALAAHLAGKATPEADFTEQLPAKSGHQAVPPVTKKLEDTGARDSNAPVLDRTLL